MLAFAKDSMKKLAPKLSLRLRVRKLLAKRVDPDMNFLAELPKYLLDDHETRCFASYFGGKHTAIDVGGCGGEYASVMARYFQQVVSVEPTPEMAAKLKAVLPANCDVMECAMGRSLGSVRLRIPKVGDARMHALSTVANHDFGFSDVGEVDTVIVEQLTLDELVRRRGIQPCFIKIDVEGYEAEVLLGGLDTIASCKPMFLIEIEKRHNKGYKEIFSLLSSYGYTPFHLKDWTLQRSSADQVDASYEFLRHGNVSGMAGVIASRASGQYINNFLFLPVHSQL